jgi:hypothetical protein
MPSVADIFKPMALALMDWRDPPPVPWERKK